MYNITISSLDGKAKEKLEVTASKNPDFSTVTRPKMHELKLKYEHIRDKQFYLRAGDEYTIHLILGESHITLSAELRLKKLSKVQRETQ